MKSEKEKMLGGEIYDCGDDALQRRWHEAKRLQAEYNAPRGRRRCWTGFSGRVARMCRSPRHSL